MADPPTPPPNILTTLVTTITSALITGTLMLLASGAQINLQTNTQNTDALLEAARKQESQYKKLNDELFKLKQENIKNEQRP
jgi:muramoyltetrapeptide carboxypeptidase LdcA involved in peptidoglycan recycling